MVKVLNIMTGGLNREGITTTQLEYMKHMDMKKIEMHIASVYPAEKDVINDFEKCGCQVIKFPVRSSNLLKYIIFLYKLIKREKYDVIHVHGSSSLMAIELFVAKVAGVKRRIAHSRNTMCLNEMANKLMRPLFNMSYNVALACGKDAGEWLFGNKEFMVFHNGKDFEKFKFNESIREQIREQMNVENRKVIGFVGNLVDQKNPFFLLDCFQSVCLECDDTTLIIVGDGELRAKLEKKVDELCIKDRVIFTGRIKNVNEIIQAFDLVLLPSKYEGLPNVVLEWQCAGLQCLVSDKVTAECKCTDLVTFLPINQGIAIWKSFIESKLKRPRDRFQNSKNACVELSKNGFEIVKSVEKLEDIYLNCEKHMGENKNDTF